MKFLLDSDIDEIVERIDSINELQGKTILMTGARGFLGRYFVHVIKKVNSNFENPVKFIGIDNQITSGVLGSDISEDDNITLIDHDSSNNLKIKERNKK